MTTKDWIDEIALIFPEIKDKIEDVEAAYLSIHINKRGISVTCLVERKSGWISETMFEKLFWR